MSMIDLGILKGVRGDTRPRRRRILVVSSRTTTTTLEVDRNVETKSEAQQRRRFAATSSQSLNLVEDEIWRREKGEREKEQKRTLPFLPPLFLLLSQRFLLPPFFRCQNIFLLLLILFQREHVRRPSSLLR